MLATCLGFLMAISCENKSVALRVKADVDNAYVYIDGELVGTTPMDIAVTPGEHSLKVVANKNDREGYEETLYLADQSAKVVEANIASILFLKKKGFIKVSGGTFTMGCTSEQGDDCFDSEKPSHQVTVSTFYMGKYEVTQKLWREVMGSDPEELNFKGCDNCPVERVSWNDIQDFIAKLNEKTGKTFRLPTEAEWEFAARGGNKSNGYKYAGSNDVDKVAWYYDNSGSKTHPVGQKKANELGLYDMSGNVYEWCSDWYGDYGSSAKTNPSGPSSGTHRILRGGGWSSYARSCRFSNRNSYDPSYRFSNDGFRLVSSS